MPLTIVISSKAYNEILKFYLNVARKYSHTYSLSFMLKNIDEARMAMLQIENKLPRRKPTLARWRGLYMASYMVNGKTRWNYAYRIEDNIVYIEDACHAQNMSEFANFHKSKGQQIVVGNLNYNYKLITN